MTTKNYWNEVPLPKLCERGGNSRMVCQYRFLINLITYLLIHFKNKTIHTENNFMYNISKASVEIIFIFDWRC